MQPHFGMERELHNKLFYKECVNDRWDFHFHSQIELCLVEDGELEVLIDDKKRVLHKGEMSVALSFVAHAYRPVGYSRSGVLVIPPHVCEEFIAALRHKKVTNPFLSDPEAVERVKDCIGKIRQPLTNEISLTGYVYLILGIVMDNVCFEQTEDVVEPELSSKILLYLHENFKKDITLPSLSATFGYSQSYISRYFKSCFHIGINRYLRIVRLKNAIMLMRENKHSVTFCALESGFNSLGTFYRVFLEEFGCSPKEYLSRIHDQ